MWCKQKCKHIWRVGIARSVWHFIVADDLPLSAAPKPNPQTATQVWTATAAVNGILLVWTSTPPIPET